MESNTKNGGISIELEHMFPIIKKWLYSEKEIFLREIVSNASDAITKLNRLYSLGEIKDIELPDPEITVSVDKEDETITVTDNGIGMSKEEVEKYICNIAISGALDFIQKYENKDENDNQDGIIGHFGLGFYSVFMVSDSVELITKSYTGAPAVRWTCDESGKYELTDEFEGSEDYVSPFGTSVILHLNDDGKEYLESGKLKGILNKYCSFMPYPVMFDDPERAKDDKEEDKGPEQINDTTPLWGKNPSDCTDEEYNEFYHKMFGDWRDPLFHIHLKADYPLNFKGILFFPKLNNDYEPVDAQVKLYYNQVFVADNIKEILPDYFIMFKGALDCPELPLNVSRSYLQNNGYVTKISNYISKKVADKINSMFGTDRENYEKIWDSIRTFVEYSCLRDPKFYDKVKNSVIFRMSDGSYLSVNEITGDEENKEEHKIYYATDLIQQAKYVKMLEENGIKVAVLDRFIDTQFINVIEMNNSKLKFQSVDSDIADSLKSEEKAEELPAVKELFEAAVKKGTTVKFEKLLDASVPAIISVPEQTRRMNEMMKMYAMHGEDAGLPESFEQILTLNTSSPVIDRINAASADDKELAEKLTKQVYNLAKLSHGDLTSDELNEIITYSYKMLEML